ncbi:MAG: MetQ/NlpA family ABC transporter substrate-binding protein [Coriobacteriaceae bacterium]|nr:MetQ/NlpA family ABC transporter substrate-binding protein [Coriobacteriaceae bacterium]
MSNFAIASRRVLVKAAFVGLGVLTLGGLTACGSSAPADDNVITVAASPAPHAEILTDFAAPALKEQGIELKVKEYTDYIQPNKDTTAGAVDANYFQHITYLDNYNKENDTDLVSAGAIHYEPLAVYAGKSSDLEAIADGATIAIPNDPTNEGRALLLLQDLGLITLKDPTDLEATPKDIKDNPHNIKFQELEAAALPRTLESVDFAVMNGNYAIEAGFHVKDALAHEDSESLAVEKYANIICVAKGSEDDEAVKALVEVLTSEDCKDYLEKTYGEDVLPAF